MRIGFLVAVLVCLGHHAFGETISFRLSGKVSAEISATEIQKKFQSQTVRVYDPNSGAEAVYSAIPIEDLFSKILGTSWKSEQSLLVTCADGYQPVIPVHRLLTEKAYLAFAKPEGGFDLIHQYENKKKVKLAPFYLVWENLNKPELKNGDGAYWPYQIVGFDFIRLNEKFPKLAPRNMTKTESAGFYQFQKYCMGCHRINGQGGTSGPELNYPVSVSEYIRPRFLSRWILDPNSMRLGTAMPGLPPDLKNRDKVARELLAYLKLMAENKKGP
ncbi:MAG: hypothetical protein IT289_09750 [Oligoflexia bacterium]|nr:hypothetical protein [Oligoflexia bacterium]